MPDFYKDLKINFSEFILKHEYFDHYSSLHGTGHIYRVMYHVLKLGTLLKMTIGLCTQDFF
ncbi:MAG: hypothetical protein V1904_07720 [Bacteroidota bacterium]